MLVGCCVKDDVRPVLRKNRLQSPFIAHRTNQYCQIEIWELPLQRFLDLVRIVFVNVKNDQMPDVVSGQLAADLTSDRTASACYQDCLPFHIAKDCIEIHLDGISWQQILNFYFLSDLFFFLHSSHSHSIAFFSRIQLSCSCRQSSSKYSISSAERKPAFCFPQIRNPCRLQCCRN